MNYLLIIFSVLLNASAQLFIKEGMSRIGRVSMSPGDLLFLVGKAVVSPPIIMGMGAYAASIVIWMVVLSRVNVSLAYPFLSIGYIVTAVLAYFLFNEPLGAQKIVGILVICTGIVILSSGRV
ncbi:MAG: EamA family transporter [Desulfovibrionaceae bacterium]|nr:EamA family transporter [Desulfovibrionaceae bacterium]